MKNDLSSINEDCGQTSVWAGLRSATPARIGLGRVGNSMPLDAVLEFQAAHAAARDAVHARLDPSSLAKALLPLTTIEVCSAVSDRGVYLKRPDLGRALDQASQSLLLAAKASFDCVFVVADGLSSIAAHRYALPVIAECLPLLKDLALGPIVFAHQSRVALGDAIGEALGARLCIMLIGERPGLSIADSLGAYITFDPKSGRRDSERNCVSNIHARGLNAGEAASTITWLVREALNRSVSGVALKDKQQTLRLPTE